MRREKREEGCPTCKHFLKEPELLLREYYARKECLQKNVIVCEDCITGPMIGMSLHEIREPFNVWCLDDGALENKVSTFHRSIKP